MMLSVTPNRTRPRQTRDMKQTTLLLDSRLRHRQLITLVLLFGISLTAASPCHVRPVVADPESEESTTTGRHLSLDVADGLGGRLVRLELERRELLPPRPDDHTTQVLVSKNKELRQWTRGTEEKSTSFAVYTDEDHSATIVALTDRRHANKNTTIYMGSFRGEDGTQYTLEPMSSAKLANNEHNSLNNHDVNLPHLKTNINKKHRRSKRQTESEGENTDEDIYNVVQGNGTETVTDLQGRTSYLYELEYKLDVLNRQDPRRNGSSDYYLQLLVVVDYALYQRWYNFTSVSNPSPSEEEVLDIIYQYYTFVAHEIGSLYQNIDADFSITLGVSGIYIATTADDSVWSELAKEYDADSDVTFTHAEVTLDAFEEWLETDKARLPVNDVAALFTGYSPFVRSIDGDIIPVSGIADIEGVCTYRRASVNRDGGLFGTINTAGHEIAHNLGAFHDGTYNNCSAVEQFIMTPVPSAVKGERRLNQYQFSDCSKERFQEHLKLLTSIGVNCLLSNHTVSTPESVYDRRVRIPPGQFYDKDRQCQMIHGQQFYFCRGDVSDQQLCYQLLCFDPRQGKCVTSSRAAEGTSCGNNKWCVSGECVEHNDAPTQKEYCSSGDTLGSLGDNVTCQDVRSSNTKRGRCYQEDFRRQCCQACDDVENRDRPECPFGDRFDWCPSFAKGSDCYTEDTRSRCCQTCKDLETPHLGSQCIYGDKAEYCHNLTANECYFSDTTCCDRCSQLRRANPDCLYGNRVSWCEEILPNRCYVPEDRDQCCEFCALNYEPVKDCEYGDKGPECTTRDCSDPNMVDFCCQTCRDFLDVVTLSTTPPHPPPSTHPVTTNSGNIGGMTTTSHTTPQPGACSDQVTSCQTIQPYECYTQDDTCCRTCSSLTTDIQGCRYGDRYRWCRYLILSVADCHVSDQDLFDCCGTCRELGVTLMVPTTTAPSLDPRNPTSSGDSVTTEAASSGSDHVTASTWTTLLKAVISTLTLASLTTADETVTVAKTTKPAVTAEPDKVPSTAMTARVSTTQSTAASSKQPPAPSTTPLEVPDNIFPKNECYGDLSEYCTLIPPRMCYESWFREPCCSTCETYRASLGDCEFGNRDEDCSVDSDLLDCNDPETRKRCCVACWEKRSIQNCQDDLTKWCRSVMNHHCYLPEIQEECCDTCRQKQIPLIGCEFGDKASWCSSILPSDCYYEQTRDVCCKTCHDSRLPFDDCLYGDLWRPDYCSDTRKHQCYDPEFREGCCGLCKAVTNALQIWATKLFPEDCDYGDKRPDCSEDNCSTPEGLRDCCFTCHNHSG